jgi:hypothetical protein
LATDSGGPPKVATKYDLVDNMGNRERERDHANCWRGRPDERPLVALTSPVDLVLRNNLNQQVHVITCGLQLDQPRPLLDIRTENAIFASSPT